MGVPTSGTTSLHARFNEEKFMGAQMPEIVPEPAGEVAGSKPRKLQWDNGEPHFSLMREDIAGTVPQRWVGSVPQNIYDPPEVRPMMSFHDPHDIPGAQVGSLKKGIVTGRALNPLNPRYPMLDGDQKPDAVPVMVEAERQHPGVHAHHLTRQGGLGASSSLPNLRSQGAAELAQHMFPAQEVHNNATMRHNYTIRPGSSGGLTPVSHGHMTPASHGRMTASGQLSRRSSARSTASGHASLGHQLTQKGITLRCQ